MAEEIQVNVVTGGEQPVQGTAGINTQLPGSPTTVSTAAQATGGIDGGNLIQPDIDEELFRFKSDDTPLMSLMLKAKKVKVNSPEVDHYMLDEPKVVLETASAVSADTSATTVALPLAAEDKKIPTPYTTLLVRGVNGYDETGAVTPGKDLMLFVVGKDTTTSNPIVRACNGPRSQAGVECTIPAIPAGSKIVVLANALYETQKKVAPDMIVPQPIRLYLQKRGMNQIVSEYFNAQRKRIPFTDAIIAEQAIANFKTKGNRTLWAGRKSKFKVDAGGDMGYQDVYTTEGIRWQFQKEVQHSGKWTIEKLIGLAKMFFTGEDVPNTAIALCGKNFLEKIQCIDYSNHPEIQITVKTNSIGWSVTNIHTVFGDFELKREPTLDRLGYSNSCALIGDGRLVHYVYSNEHSFNDKVEGEEAKRSGVLVWDGLGLKGSCHIWVDGEGEGANAGAKTFVFWDSTTAPTTTSGTESSVYYFLNDVTLSEGVSAKAGESWYYDGSTWKEYVGEITETDSVAA